MYFNEARLVYNIMSEHISIVRTELQFYLSAVQANLDLYRHVSCRTFGMDIFCVV